MDGCKFTDRTRRALHAAGDEAAALQHEYIGTEHILLALLRDSDSVALAFLANVHSDIDGIRAKINAVVKPGSAVVPAGTERPYTSRAKKVVELAMLCAREDNRSSIGTQHLLLGLLREKKGIAAQVLVHSGVTEDQVATALGGVRHDE